MSEPKYIRVDRVKETVPRYIWEQLKNFHTYTPADILAGCWVPVSERKPEHCEYVLAFYSGNDDEPDGRIDIGWVGYEGKFRYEEIFGPVTHWMPLPAAPLKEGDKL